MGEMSKLESYTEKQLDPSALVAAVKAELSRNGRCSYQQLCNEEWHASSAYRCRWIVDHHVHFCPRFRRKGGGKES